MMLRKKSLAIEAERITLRLPEMRDHLMWAHQRQTSQDFLKPWEPVWSQDHFSKESFRNRVYWARKTYLAGNGMPLFLVRRDDQQLLGAVTCDNIRRGPAQSGTLGYWIGSDFARKGYMAEALRAVVHHAFNDMGLSRIDAACLPENTASRGLLEKTSFKYEGVAQSYLQIAGRWRTHVLYANIRHDRRGKTEAGLHA